MINYNVKRKHNIFRRDIISASKLVFNIKVLVNISMNSYVKETASDENCKQYCSKILSRK